VLCTAIWMPRSACPTVRSLEGAGSTQARPRPLSPPGCAGRGVRKRVCGRRPQRSARTTSAQPARLCRARRTEASVRPEAATERSKSVRSARPAVPGVAYGSECAAGGRNGALEQRPLSPPGCAGRGVRKRVCGRRPQRSARTASAQPARLCRAWRTEASVRPEAATERSNSVRSARPAVPGVAYGSECAAGGRNGALAQRPLSPPGCAGRGVRKRVCGRRPQRSARTASAQPARLCRAWRTEASVRPEAATERSHSVRSARPAVPGVAYGSECAAGGRNGALKKQKRRAREGTPRWFLSNRFERAV